MTPRTRISGTLAKRPAASSAVNSFYLATKAGSVDEVYVSNGKNWFVRSSLDEGDNNGHMSGLDADKPSASSAIGWIYHATDNGNTYEAFPSGWFLTSIGGPSLAKLREKLGRSFGIRLQSTGSKANVALTRIVVQTCFVSPKKPCLITFDQHILTPFTGLGKFDLVESDPSGLSGGVGDIVIATKSGFTDGVTTGGWSRLVKVNTSYKVYKVNFVPGTAGDGFFSINVRELNVPLQKEAQ